MFRLLGIFRQFKENTSFERGDFDKNLVNECMNDGRGGTRMCPSPEAKVFPLLSPGSLNLTIYVINSSVCLLFIF
jgi:hypothetical protein